MRVVICGGGIIGASVAYHLALRGVSSTVVERCDVACGASGKAGGFLARTWCDDYGLGPMARLSFDLHMQFAEKENFSGCDYRRLDTLSVTARTGADKRGKTGNNPDWLDGSVVSSSVLGTTKDTAQVHPYKLTHNLLDEAARLVESKVVKGIVQGIDMEENKVKGVKASGEVIPADVAVIAMGPWSGTASQWFDIPTIRGQRAHHVVIAPQEAVTAHALFVEYQQKNRTPEVYPRPDGQVYICGMCDKEKLPEDPALVQFNKDSCDKLRQMASEVSSKLDGGEIIREGACYLPVPPRDSLPVIGCIPGCEGGYIAAGHSCWGILNAPATGLAMSELILDGEAKCLDLSPFDPKREL